MPIIRIIEETVLVDGITCETRVANPVAAATDDRASSIGTPAATIAPKAISRISSVTGRDRSAALPRSVATWSLTCLFMVTPPASSTRRPG